MVLCPYRRNTRVCRPRGGSRSFPAYHYSQWSTCVSFSCSSRLCQFRSPGNTVRVQRTITYGCSLGTLCCLCPGAADEKASYQLGQLTLIWSAFQIMRREVVMRMHDSFSSSGWGIQRLPPGTLAHGGLFLAWLVRGFHCIPFLQEGEGTGTFTKCWRTGTSQNGATFPWIANSYPGIFNSCLLVHSGNFTSVNHHSN